MHNMNIVINDELADALHELESNWVNGNLTSDLCQLVVTLIIRQYRESGRNATEEWAATHAKLASEDRRIPNDSNVIDLDAARRRLRGHSYKDNDVA